MLTSMPDFYDTKKKMRMTEEQKRIARLQDGITRANRARRKAEGEWLEAIMAAHEGGVSLRRIGEHAGLSHARVLQIIRKEQERRERDSDG